MQKNLNFGKKKMARQRDSFDCFSWMFGRKKYDKGNTNELNLEPVILVPGIAGSILNAVNVKNNSSERVWVRIFLASCEFKKKLWSKFDPSSGMTKSLDPGYRIEVPGDDYGLFAMDLLDPSWFPRLFHVNDLYYFHDLIDTLLDCGYEKGTTLFGYGYDFRQSNRLPNAMEGFKEKIEEAYKASGGKKVNIISHSMGGLLVKCFLSLYGEFFEKFVNSWICIACPFQGCPGFINDCLLTGMQFIYGLANYLFISRWTTHQLLIECPSIYEMMTNVEFNWKKLPQIQVWRKLSDDDGNSYSELESYGPKESILLFQQALQDNKLSYDGKKIPVPFNMDIFEWSEKTRLLLSTAKLPDNFRFFNIYGTTYDTPFNVCYGSESSPLQSFQDICHSEPHYYNTDGDGTVPSESAKADGFNAVARIAVEDTHRGLTKSDHVFSLIKQWLRMSNSSLFPKKMISYSIRLQDCENADDNSDAGKELYVLDEDIMLPKSCNIDL